MLPKGVLADTSVVKATVRSVAFATEVGAYTILYPFDGGSGRCTSNTPRHGQFHNGGGVRCTPGQPRRAEFLLQH